MNQNWKNDFLNFTSVNKRLNHDKLFDRINGLEEKFNLDLCEFDKNQLIELFNMESVQTQLAYQRVFVSNYLDFCYLKEYTKKPNVIKKSNITLTELMEINPNIGTDRVLYISPSRYEKYLELLGSDVNGTYLKTMFMAIYEGILGKLYDDLTFLSIKDVDRVNNTVKLHCGKRIHVSEKLVSQLIAASNIDLIVGNTRKMYLKDTLENDAVFKTYSKLTTSYEKKVESARRKFYTYMTEYISLIVDNDEVNANMIYTSGMVNYVLGKLKSNNQDLKVDTKATEDYLKEFGLEISYNHFRTYYYKYINSYYAET